MARTRPGAMRHRVQYQTGLIEADDYGQPSKTWTTAGTYWARIDTPTARDRERLGTVGVEVTHAVTIRGRIPLSKSGRLVYSGRTFEIVFVIDPEERGIESTAYCKELAD